VKYRYLGSRRLATIAVSLAVQAESYVAIALRRSASADAGGPGDSGQPVTSAIAAATTSLGETLE
jgi:hypothetical protein